MMSSSVPPGYRKKPLYVIVAAALFMAAPIGNMIFSLIALRGDPTRWVSWKAWAAQVSTFSWVLAILTFAAGVSLLFVRRYSWIFAGAMVLLAVFHNLTYVGFLGPRSPWILAGLFVGSIAALAFLASKQFRHPYLNPRVRWWETSPRYRADIPVELTPIGIRGVLVDISQTGALVEVAADATFGEAPLHLKLNDSLSVPSRFVRRALEGKAAGLQFEYPDRALKKAVAGYLEQLADDPSRLVR